MHFSYDSVFKMGDIPVYHLTHMSTTITPNITREFLHSQNWHLVRYLEVKRQWFFASSLYLVTNGRIIELNLDDISRKAFSKNHYDVYFMDLAQFMSICNDNFELLQANLDKKLIVVVDGKTTQPSQDSFLISKIIKVGV